MADTATTSGEGFRKDGSKNSLGARVFLFLFGIPFFGMGGFFMYIGALKPLWDSMQSRGWVETPCTILTSEVGRHSSSDGTTYSIDITFTYEWNGRTYESDSYGLITMASGGRSGKEEAVRENPPGARRTCWVNPDRPSQAIISRELGMMPWFILPFSGIFVLIGGGVMYGALTGKVTGEGKSKGFRKSSKSARALGRTPENRRKGLRAGGFPAYEADPLVLKPEVGRIAGLVGIIIFALFWNGIVSIFVFQVAKGFARGDPEWFLALFMIPFLLVGLGLVAGVVYTALSLFNPTVELTLTPGTPRLGESCMLEWRFEGNVKRLKGLKLILEAEEVARYRRGTSTYTDRNIFEQVVLVDVDADAMHTSGHIDFALPPDTAPSFKSTNNEILWTVKVHGPISRWPDVSAAFPITVLPQA